MSKNNVPKLAVLFMVLAISGVGIAQSSQPKNKTAPAEPQLRGPNTKEGASQAHKSTQVLNEIMGVPDKGIPRDLLAKAECVAVFPKVVCDRPTSAAKPDCYVAPCVAARDCVFRQRACASCSFCTQFAKSATIG